MYVLTTAPSGLVVGIAINSKEQAVAEGSCTHVMNHCKS